MGRVLRAGSAAVVRAGRRQGRVLVAALDRFRACRRARSARCANGSGCREISSFAKYTVNGRGRRRLARPHARLPAAEARPHDADADAQGGRQADRRFHAGQSRQGRMVHRRLGHCRAVSYALVREASAADGSVAIEALGVKLAGLSIAGPNARKVLAEGDARRCLERRVLRSWHPPHRHRHGAVPGRPRQLYRRSRLRDLGGAGIPAARVRDADGGRRGVRHRPVRLARAQCAAAGEELRLMGARVPADLRPAGGRARPFRRLFARTPISSARRRRSPSARRAASSGCAPSSSMPTMPTSSATSRSGSAARCAAGSPRAATRTMRRRRSRWAMCRRRSPTRADGFEIELLGKRLAARIQPAPLFDANFERMRG